MAKDSKKLTVDRLNTWFNALRTNPDPSLDRQPHMAQKCVHWIYSDESSKKSPVLHHFAKYDVEDEKEILVVGFALHERFKASDFGREFVPTLLRQLANLLPHLSISVGMISNLEGRRALWINQHIQIETLFISPYLHATKDAQSPPQPLVILVDELHLCREGVLTAICDFMQQTLQSDLPIWFAVSSHGRHRTIRREFKKRDLVWSHLDLNPLEDAQCSTRSISTEEEPRRPRGVGTTHTQPSITRDPPNQPKPSGPQSFDGAHNFSANTLVAGGTNNVTVAGPYCANATVQYIIPPDPQRLGIPQATPNSLLLNHLSGVAIGQAVTD